MCILKFYSLTIPFTDVVGDNIVKVYSVIQKGDIISKMTGKVADYHRVTIDVSTAEWDNFIQQVADATLFLNKHSDYLIDIIKNHHSSDAYLDFPIYSRLGGVSRIVNQNDRLPSGLIEIAGKIKLGIVMSIYSADAFDDVAGN